jgi:hypothetical protein
MKGRANTLIISGRAGAVIDLSGAGRAHHNAGISQR